MAPPFFANISQNINGLLNKDFYHNTPINVNLSTKTKNGIQFNVNGKQSNKENNLTTNLETKFFDKFTGLSLTQSWSNENKLNSKIEINDLLPGVKSDFQTNLIPNGENIVKNAIINLSIVQPFATAKLTFDILKKPIFISNLTLAHEGFVTGAEFGYDITNASISRYAIAMTYMGRDYNLGISINNLQLTTASFYQSVNRSLQIGAKATLNPKINSNVNMEFATRYLPDSTSQLKAKINDQGKLTCSYKQELRPGITMGVGATMDALKLNEPFNKFGWSLNFET